MESIQDQLIEGFENNSLDDILGQDSVKNGLKSALFAGHNVLIVGEPGVGKTTLARNVSKILGDIEVNDCSWNCDPDNPQCPECLNSEGDIDTKVVSGEDRFVRVQGSPELTAEDLLGDIDPGKAMEYGPLSVEAFTPGKLFRANNGVLFFDEINRAPEKLQNALLQVLEEGYATVGSYTVDFETNFAFIATMNPEDVSTEELSDVLVDRFDFVYMSYPEDLEIEKRIVLEKGDKFLDFEDGVLDFLIGFVRSLRSDDDFDKVPSVRGSISLYERSQTQALVNSVDQVGFDEVESVVGSVLGHRVRLKPSLKYAEDSRELVKEKFSDFLENSKVEGSDFVGDDP